MGNEKLLIVVLLLIGIALFVNAAAIMWDKDNGQLSFQGLDKCSPQGATTSATYLTSNAATSTIAECPTRNASWGSMYVQIKASSSAVAVNLVLEGSYDRKDWFPIENDSLSSTVVFNVYTTAGSDYIYGHTATGTVHQWSGLGGATTSHRITLLNIVDRFVRVRGQAAGGGAAVWIQMNLRGE